MRNKYRVDVTDTLVVPCGMSTIRYLGMDIDRARKVFDDTQGNVLLSMWNEDTRDFVVFGVKETES